MDMALSESGAQKSNRLSENPKGFHWMITPKESIASRHFKEEAQ